MCCQTPEQYNQIISLIKYNTLSQATSVEANKNSQCFQNFYNRDMDLSGLNNSCFIAAI